MPCLRWFLQSLALQRPSPQLALARSSERVLDAPVLVEPGNKQLQKEVLVPPEVAPSLKELLACGILGLLPQENIIGGLH